MMEALRQCKYWSIDRHCCAAYTLVDCARAVAAKADRARAVNCMVEGGRAGRTGVERVCEGRGRGGLIQ